MNIDRPIRFVFLLLLLATRAGAQGVSTSLTDGPVQELVRFDGVTLVHETRGFDGFIQVETVAIADLDMNGTTMVSNPTIAAISLRCRTTSGSCIRTTATVRVGGSVQTVNDTAAENSLRCRPADCARLLTAIRGGSVVGGTPAAPRTPINCEALRATYVSGGARITLPPECAGDLDRQSAYQPGRAAQPPQSAPPETAIDGSRIPSQIDFGRPSSSPIGPPSAPRTPLPAPSPTPRLESSPQPSATVSIPSSPSPSAQPPAAGADPFAPIPVTFGDMFRNFVRWARETASAGMQAARDLVSEYSKGVGPFLFDEWTGDDFDGGPTALLKGYLHEQVEDEAARLLESETSRSVLGRPVTELPIEFRRDKAVWDAAAKHAFEGKTLTGGFDEVGAIGQLIPLPVEPKVHR